MGFSVANSLSILDLANELTTAGSNLASLQSIAVVRASDPLAGSLFTVDYATARSYFASI